MKTIIYSFLSLLFSTSLFAQDSLTSYKPTAGDCVLSIGLINNSAFWMAKKYKTDSKACRLGLLGSFAMNPKSSNTITNTTTGYSSTISSSSYSFAIGLSLGAQKSLGNLKKVEPYVGMDFALIYNYSTRSTEITRTDPLENSRTETKETNPSRTSLSILPLVGVNYYIAPRLAIGAEYRLSLASVGYDTGYHYSSKEWSSTGTETFLETTRNEGSFLFNGNLTGTAYITATLFFH